MSVYIELRQSPTTTRMQDALAALDLRHQALRVVWTAPQLYKQLRYDRNAMANALMVELLAQEVEDTGKPARPPCHDLSQLPPTESESGPEDPAAVLELASHERIQSALAFFLAFQPEGRAREIDVFVTVDRVRYKCSQVVPGMWQCAHCRIGEVAYMDTQGLHSAKECPNCCRRITVLDNHPAPLV